MCAFQRELYAATSPVPRVVSQLEHAAQGEFDVGDVRRVSAALEASIAPNTAKAFRAALHRFGVLLVTLRDAECVTDLDRGLDRQAAGERLVEHRGELWLRLGPLRPAARSRVGGYSAV